jgi:hypothetical protein
VIEALKGDGSARAVLEAGRATRLELGIAKTFDDSEAPDYGGTLPDTPLGAYVQKGLVRLDRPSSRVGQGRVGEMVIGADDGNEDLLPGLKSERNIEHTLRDAELVSAAFYWGAVAFVTRDARVLRNKRLRDKGWRAVTPEEVLDQLRLAAPRGRKAD